MTKPTKKQIIIGLSVVLAISLVFIFSKKKKPKVPLAPTGGRKVFTSGTNVNLRNGPSTDHDVISNITEAGTLLGTAIETEQDSAGGPLHWVKIQPDAALGVDQVFYVREDLLKI